MNILIIDDEKVIREGVKRTIQSSFHHMSILTAGSGEEALEVLNNQTMDIVILDIKMPGMSGLELLGQCRKANLRTKWIVLSAYSDFYFAQEALRHGAKDYILKPIGKPKLLKLIAELQAEIRQEQEQESSQDLLARNLNYLREAIFQRWVEGLNIGHFDIAYIAQRYPVFHLIIIRLDPVKDLTLNHFIADNILSEIMGQFGEGFTIRFGSESLVGLFTPDPNTRMELLENKLRITLDRCLKQAYTLQITEKSDNFMLIPQIIRRIELDSILPFHEKQDVNSPSKSEPSNMIDVAMQYIQTHYEDNLTLEKVAAAIYLNKVYFSQLFKQKTGIGFKDYVIELRMTKAKELLKEPQLRVADVAELVGYQDMRYFTQVFRKTIGTTPTEYRRGLGLHL